MPIYCWKLLGSLDMACLTYGRLIFLYYVYLNLHPSSRHAEICRQGRDTAPGWGRERWKLIRKQMNGLVLMYLSKTELSGKIMKKTSFISRCHLTYLPFYSQNYPFFRKKIIKPTGINRDADFASKENLSPKSEISLKFMTYCPVVYQMNCIQRELNCVQTNHKAVLIQLNTVMFRFR